MTCGNRRDNPVLARLVVTGHTDQAQGEYPTRVSRGEIASAARAVSICSNPRMRVRYECRAADVTHRRGTSGRGTRESCSGSKVGTEPEPPYLE